MASITPITKLTYQDYVCYPDDGKRHEIITPIKIKGSPDLVVEVLSPSTAKNDRQLKRQICQRAGVGEYWIVDAQERTLLQLILRDGQYAEQPHDDTVALSVIANVSVELSQVW